MDAMSQTRCYECDENVPENIKDMMEARIKLLKIEGGFDQEQPKSLIWIKNIYIKWGL